VHSLLRRDVYVFVFLLCICFVGLNTCKLTQSRAGAVHCVFDVLGLFQQALDGGDFIGDGGGWGADWDEAEVCCLHDTSNR
jgi:hypothetical protein